MSMINRMLSDLERRGAPKPRGGGEELVPERPRRRRRRFPLRALSLALAVVLVGIAVALWIARGERVLAGWQSLAGSAEAETVAPAPELVGLAFEGADERPRLVLRLSEAIGRDPRYSRSAGSASVALAARADEVMVPAPPAGQAVFRGIALEGRGDARTRVRLEVAPAAELDLRVEGRRIVVTGRLAAAESSADGSGNGTSAGASAANRSAGSADTQRSAASAGGSTNGEGGGEQQVASEPPEDAATAESSTAAADADAGNGVAGASDGAQAAAPTGEAATLGGETAPDEPESATQARAAGDDDAATKQATAAAGAEPAGDGTAAAQTVRKTQSLPAEKRARRRYREARQALNAGELGAARRLLAEAIGLDPMLHPARDLAVGLLRRVGDTAAARRLLEEGVALAPGRIEYAMPLARLLVDTGELQRAARVLARARAAGAGNAGFHALAAAVAQRRGQHEQAARDYTRALEVDGGNGLWWLGLGISLAATDRAGEARAALREARASGDLSDSLDRWAEGRIDELGGGSEG